jgi:hypothetical protein
MPYIKNRAEREDLAGLIEDFLHLFEKKGNLNYFLCKLFKSRDLNYENARNFIGELECAKMEIYRRWIALYEDIKKKENGDV